MSLDNKYGKYSYDTLTGEVEPSFRLLFRGEASEVESENDRDEDIEIWLRGE